MREILFRGKDLETGKWLYGSFVNTPNHTYISTNGEAFPAKVEPKTVGQYTGLTDKNGVKIFEGDIVRNIESGTKALVQFFPEHGAFMAWIRNESFSINQVENLGEIEMPEIEVIGNIYDTPELIGGGAE